MQNLFARVPELPLFGGSTAALLAACDGREEHVPFTANLAGLGLAAGEMEGLSFPREAAARLLRDYNRELTAPAPALTNCERLADPRALVIATGQQPMAGGGPLMIFFKALTTISLARKAEEMLGVPVIPLFWNASEDHDLDEMAKLSVPGPKGEVVLSRADLQGWKGCSVSAVTAADGWQAPLKSFLAKLPSLGGNPAALATFSPDATEGWARYFSRLMATLLGGEGLVVVEPDCIRSLAAPIFARVIREWRQVAALLEDSWRERPAREDVRSFPALEGPPVFFEYERRRRRILAHDEGFTLRGEDLVFSLSELVDLVGEKPRLFSAHGSLRPIVQDSIFPVVANVLGPGEITYFAELFRFHHSPLGGGRRLPLVWPRLSGTVLDPRATATVTRFGLSVNDIFLHQAELLAKCSRAGSFGDEIDRLKALVKEELEGIGERAKRLEPTLSSPCERSWQKVNRALTGLGEKIAAAEARVQGFAPEKLRRLASWTRPGGRAQERVFALAALPELATPEMCRTLCAQLDPTDFCHRLIRLT